MKKILTIAAFLSATLAGGAQAAGLALLTPVLIDAQAQVPESVLKECRIDYAVETNVLAALRRYDRDAATTPDASVGRVLKVTITYVLGVGGGSFTGPKAIAVQSQILNEGKVEFSAKMHRRSGMGGGFRGTCELLDGASKGLAKIVAKWAQSPSNKFKDAEETEAPRADEAASAASVPE